MLGRTLPQVLFVLRQVPVDEQAFRFRHRRILIDENEYVTSADVAVQNFRLSPRITVTYAADQRRSRGKVSNTMITNLPERQRL